MKRKQREWFRILRDLMAKGVSMAAVARACGKCGANTVQHWADGGDPKDADARIVLALYRKHCPEQYRAHMLEFEPQALEFVDRVYVKPDNAIRGKPKPHRVAVVPAGQFDFFVQEAA